MIFDIFWQNNTGPGKAITVLILALGVLATGCALFHRRRYGTFEVRWLENVRAKLRRAQEAQPVPSEETDNVQRQNVVRLDDLSEGVPLRSLIGDRLAAISRMKQARVKVNVSALQQMTILKESAKSTLAFPAYVVSLAMMLGLLGTFIGLSLMIQNMQVALPNISGSSSTVNWTASVNNLTKIIAGKKTAFSATLAGLTCSIFLSWLNFLLARRQSDFYNRLERFTAEELLPATVPAIEDETVMEKLAMQLGDSFERLREITSDNAHNVEQMVAMERAFATTVESIRSITEHDATAPAAGLPEMSNIVGQLAQVNSSVITVTEQIPQILHAIKQGQQAAFSEIGTVMREQHSRLEHVLRTIQAERQSASPWISPVANRETGATGTNLRLIVLGGTLAVLLVLAIRLWL